MARRYPQGVRLLVRTTTDQSLKVTRFGELKIRQSAGRRSPATRNRALVRVEYASVGVTDVMAAGADAGTGDRCSFLFRPLASAPA